MSVPWQFVIDLVQRFARVDRLGGAAALLLLCADFAAAQTPGVRLVEDASRDSQILRPTLGRPAFVAPGDRLEVVAVSTAGAGAVPTARLVSRRWPQATYALAAEGDAAAALLAGAPATFVVPASTPPRVYDLEISVGGRELTARHCVAVGSVGRHVRLIHLSDMNIGELSAPDFDPRLAAELNLLGADVIVATGDVVDVTHRNPELGWRRFVDFVALLNAPVVVACGDHDSIDLYSRFVAPSPIGAVYVGPHRVLILNDHLRSPLANDADQIRWVEQTLSGPAGGGTTVVVSHAGRPNLLAVWRQQGTLRDFVTGGGVRLWFSGGADDWDGSEYRDLIAAADSLNYVRTGQASAAAFGDSKGAARYRVVELWGGDVEGAAKTRVDVRAALPVGSLDVDTDGRNDGSATRLLVSARNASRESVDGVTNRLYLAKGDVPPWSQGGELARVIDHGEFWEAWVRLDLADLATARVLVGSDAPGPSPPWAVKIDAPEELTLSRGVSPDGVTYLSTASEAVTIEIANRGATAATTTPIVKLDGRRLAYRVLGVAEQPHLLRRMRIEPGQLVHLQPDLSAIRVDSGRRTLQVYLAGADVVTPHVRPVEIRIRN